MEKESSKLINVKRNNNTMVVKTCLFDYLNDNLTIINESKVSR